MRQFRPMAIGMASLAMAFAAMAADSWVATVDPLNGVTCAEGARSADARLDNRALSRTVHALVHGTEMKSESPETPAAVWDTTQESEGWHTYTASSNEVKVLVRNDPSIAIEGGRLHSDETWTADRVHIVRHKVLVPSGYRLTVEEGAVVKFGEGTGIEVLSGGKLTLSGRPDKRTCLTSIADDIFGGDTDCLATNAVYGTWSISATDSTDLDSYYTHIRFGTVSVLPTVGMAASYTTGLRSEGRVRINVSVSGSRSNRFSLHWRIKEGTAKFGEDNLQSEGEAEWPNTTDSAYWFEIPIAEKTSSDEIKHFTVEIFSTEDCNVNSGSLRTEVAITPKTDLPAAISAESAISEAIRLENRSEGTTGKALSHGTEWKSANGESRAVAWNTTAESDGWKEFFDGSNSVKALVRNDPSIAVEGGRLQSNETWTASQTHLVRNRVIVPSGVTLTVTTNAVIKFCENTGITVNSGGQLIVLAATNAPAIFTSVADDTVGGDTDIKEATAVNDQYTISVSGTYSSTAGAVFRYTTFSSLPTISIPSGAEVSESDEIVRIPVSVSGTRSAPFLLRWRTINDTAEYGTDFTVNSGVIEWSSSSDAAKTITIPIANDGIAEESEKFIVELYDAQDANVSRSAYRCTVIVRDSTQTYVPVAISAESEISGSIRLENRAEGTFGKALVHGSEWKSADGVTRAELWDTTQEEDGWKTFGEESNTVQVVVRNDPSIAIEGGRMQSNETWAAEAVHLVRNTVIVPSGVTLTVMTNTVVKFCEKTGITVNSGGQLIVVGSTNEPAVFASVADDTVGGDTDLREAMPADGLYTISMSGSYSSPAGAVFRHTTFSTLPTVSITSGCEVNESDEQVKVAISVSGSRTAPFRLFWRAIDDSAEYGSDYTLKEGAIDWGTSSDSTKYIIIPIANDGEPEESEKFVIELYEAQNANVSRSAYRCTVTVRDSTPTEIPVAISAESEISAPIRLENRAEGTLAKALVHGSEWKSVDGETRASLWDTTQEEDGWKTFGEGSNAVQVLVRNDPSISIEGGRLLSNETWTASQTHLVRNWVIVPSGVTLTITTNAVVKFCEKTGIQVNSGGRLDILGNLDENIVITTAADDTIGGDSDMRTVAPSSGWYSISNSGTLYDEGLVSRYYALGSLPNVSLTSAFIVDAEKGIVRLPVYVSGSRTRTFSMDWTTSLGESGRLVWTGTSEGTKWLTFPVTLDTPDFTFNLVKGCGCNISTPAVSYVDLYSNIVKRAVCTGSEISAPVRLETRNIETSYAAPLVTGVQQISGENGSGHVDWDTTDAADGWQTVNCGGQDATLWVVNDASIAVEGGRVLSSMTWTPDQVRLVRHWVIVPSGVTLTIAAGTVVKFCDQTGIKVESGGKLICDGTSVADVILTSVHDDTAGGDTDGKEIAPKTGYYSISSSGTFTDTYTAMRYGTSGTFGSASIASQVIGKKQSGHVRIPVAISTSRSTPFAVDWVAIDGTAKFGEDYLCASGRVEWTSSSAGTKYIDMPLERMAETSPDESFTARLTYGRGINLNTTTCTVKLYDTVDDVLTGNHVGFSASDWADVVPVDTAAGNEPLFVFGEVPVRYSTQWETNGARVRVTSTDVDDARSTLYVSDAAAEGWYPWLSESYADGRYDLAHVVADAVGEVVASNTSVFIVNRDVRVHGGSLNADETWSKDYVHYVRSTVTVQPGVTLTIEPGAVVKFRSGAGIVVASGGTAVGRGAVFTHASDDTVGGDTFFDGQDLEPQDGKYTLSGNWILDSATQRRYQSAVTVGGTISTNTHWTGHQTYKVTSQIVVPAGVTLEIDPGAVLKFVSSNCSSASDAVPLTVNSNATLKANGTVDSPIVFTSYRDDLHGDTNGDGTNTVAAMGDWPRIYANGTVDMDHCWLRYCNASNGRGAIEGVCGRVTFNNGIIEHSTADCVKMSGGSFAAHNSVFRDSAAAFGDTTGAAITINNCLVTRCPIACRGSGKAFNNTVFINCEAFFETDDNVCAGCVFYNSEGFGAREDAMPEGGVWTDPLLVDYENGDYSLTEDSPCIDAGVSVFTTTLLDFVGNDRVVNGVIDIGPCEYDSHVNTRSMVRFYLGLYGTRTGGGELVQTITNGCAAVAPTFSVADGWSFVDWDSDFSCVTNNMTVTAQWARVPKTVTVETTRGVAPQAGENQVFWGDTFTLVSPDPVVNGTTQYVCRGASAYPPVRDRFDILVTNDVTVVWDVWATNYWLAIEGGTNGLGTVTGASGGWKLEGSEATLIAKAENGVFFMGWTGDTNGCKIAGRTITVRMDCPRTIRAVFAQLKLDMSEAVETVPFTGRILLDGRQVGLTCEVGADPLATSYVWESDVSMFVASGGTGIGLTGDDVNTSYLLPFQFPFYGRLYEKVYPNSNGVIFFDAGNNAHTYSDDTFRSHPMIAGLWKDMKNGNVYVTKATDSVTFRWKSVYYSSGGAVNFSITLYKSGEIRTSYGSGNADGGAVGISSGEGGNNLLINGDTRSLNLSRDVRFIPCGMLPEWLTLSESGVFTGTPTEAGDYTFYVLVRDADGRETIMPVTIVVEENANKRPVVQGGIPSATTTHVVAGTNATFAVVATDPNGDALSYIWTLDGVEQKAVTASNYVFTANFATHGSHALACAVTDGLWTIDAGSWRIESNCSLYVDAESGDDAQTGASETLAKRTLQSAVNAAIDGDSIFAAAGTYEHVTTSNKAVRIEGVKGYEQTFIDGGGTNRCIWVGSGNEFTNTAFVGFTICNGYAQGGAGSVGGTFDYCIFRDCDASKPNDDGSANWAGGAANWALMRNCLMTGCHAPRGGATYGATLVNCTVVGNSASNHGGGTCEGTAVNCIIVNNDAPSGANYYYGTLTYTCTDPLPSGTGNICENPRFTDADGGDFRLRQYSPCLDVGNNAAVVGAYDLAGANRIVNGRVDLGAYEGWVYLPVPPEVGGLEAEVDRRIGIVRLKWAEEEFARSYKVFRATVNDVESAEEIGTTTDCFFDDETADPETDYWYWVAAANPTGIGPKRTSVKGRCLGAMTFGGSELAAGTVGLAYRTQLEVSGGSGKYTWTSGADDYDIIRGESTFMMDIDEPHGILSGDDVCVAYPLPFDFPFYGKSYNKLWISSNGTLAFDGEYKAYTPSVDALKSHVMIAPFWKDLMQGNGGVYVSENGEESITFIWYECIYHSGQTRVNASATLFADGTVLCSYGEGNANGAFVGVSAGDGNRYRYYDWLNKSLNNADDAIFAPQDVPGGLTLEPDGTISGKPNAPGTYVFTVFVTDDLGNGATQQVTLEVAENPNLRSVEFDLGEYGIRGGGGELVQYLMIGESAVPPSVRVRVGWVFDGWVGSYSNITDNTTVTAKYRTSHPDLHVDSVEIPETVAAGQQLEVAWTVGNTGNPAFTGTMNERIVLVSVADSNDVRVAATVKFEGTIARDGSVERSATVTVPLKGWDGSWRVRIETAVSPSMREAGEENARTAERELEITPVPLPNLVAGAIAADAALEPGKAITVTYQEKNEGASAANAPWTDVVYLESVDAGASVRLGAVERDEDLAAEGTVSVAASFVLPEQIALSGNVKVRVVVDADDQVVESDESNEFVGTGILSLLTKLYLSGASDSVKENVTSGVRYTVKRSGPTTEPMTIVLSADSAGLVTMPETVTIPAGNASTIFTVKPIDNNIVEGSRTVAITAASGSCRSATAELTILDNEVPKLTLTLDKTTLREGEGKIVATVTRELVTDEPLTVYLSGVSTSRCSYPSSVVIPAGEASVTFEISTVDNNAAEITAELTLRVSASGWTSGSVSYQVEDDDVPGVTMSIMPEIVSEGAGSQAVYAKLVRSDMKQIDKAIRVRLTPSVTGQLRVPSEVTIPRYVMDYSFAIGVVDNREDDGDREVEINGAVVIESCGCSGQPSNGDVIRAVVGIVDDDGPALSLSADPTTMMENLSPAGYLTLSRNSVSDQELTVRLWVDAENEDEIEVPETVSIPAGERSIKIPVNTPNDGVEDGTQQVAVYAEDVEDVFAPASTWIQVSDQNLPDLSVGATTLSGQSLVALEKFTVSFEIANSGFEARAGGVPYSVYIVRGTGNATPTEANLMKTGRATADVPVGGAVTVTEELDVPEMPADYQVAIVLDPDGEITELNDMNNSGWSAAFAVQSAYHATAGVDSATYLPGEEVVITGKATMTTGGAPADKVPIDVNVYVSGMRRTLKATTADDGTYSVSFVSTSGETGHYTVGACYPGMNSSVTSASFDILGMKRTSVDNVVWDIRVGDVVTRTVYIQNLSAAALTDLQVSFKNLPTECVMTPQLPTTLPGNSTVALSLQALADSVTDQVDYRRFTVQVTSSEGVRLEFPAYFHSQSQRAYLRISPSSVNTTMAVGFTRYFDFTLVNDGKGDTGRVSISIPNAGWLRLASASVIDNLASGESAVITLEVSPSVSDRLTLNSPLKGGCMAVNCANGDGCSVSLQFTPVSEATGSVSIDVSDNNTFMLESAPHLANASVRITNPYTGALVASGTTDETGHWSKAGLPEGRYQLSVTASEHDSYADELIVNPGAESMVDAYLQNKVVQVDWKVEKTEIVDQYVVKQEIKYETQVPAPVVRTILPDALQELKDGESSSFVIVLENTGVIAAERVTVSMPSIPGCVFELSDNDITLPAKSSKMIAAKISRPAPKLMKAKLLAASNEPVNECWYKARTEVEYPCGEKHPTYSYETQLKYGECVYASEAMAVALAQGWGWIGGGGGSSSGGGYIGGGSTYVAPPSRGDSSVQKTNTGDFSAGGGNTNVKKNCNPCLTTLSEALESVAPDVAKSLLKSARDKIRDEMLGKIPFMSCVDFLVNGSMALFGKPVKNVVAWVENLPVFRQTIKGHFESYDEKRTVVHAIFDGSIDLASCGADVLAAIASAASEGTATVPAFATSAKAKDFLRKIKDFKDKVLDPVSNLRQLEQAGEDVYFDVLKGKLDPDSDLGKRLRIACKLDPATEARLTDAIKDVVVAEGAIDDMLKLMDETTGGLYDLDINWEDIDDFFKNADDFRDDTDDTKFDPDKTKSYNPPSASGGGSSGGGSGMDMGGDVVVMTQDRIDDFVDKWNKGVDVWMDDGDVPPDAVDFEKILYHSIRLKAVQEYLGGRGVTTIPDLLANAIAEIETVVDESEDAVCASVTLKLSQTYAMTREAFNGTLTLYNGNWTTAITDLKMNVSVLDEDGNECRDLFVLNDLGTSGAMSSGWVLDGGLSISVGGTGSATIQFVPSRDAAPTEPKIYRFGGTITYVDPFTGENATMRLTPVALTVNPSPYLKLDYFIQRDVYADDPFTPDVVEASMPAEMSVLIRNEGGGDAKNVTIASVQPEVVQNDKGLDIEFTLKDYVLEKTALNGATAHLGLNTVNLGTVTAGESQIAQWWLTSSIEGHFVGLSATVTPVNSWNRPDTSLVNPEVGTHKLIRSLAVEGEKMPYFLTSENSNLHGTPDTIYAPNGDCESVRNDGSVTWGGALRGANPTLTITVAARDAGWHYLNANVTGLFRYEVVSVVRSDGKTIPVRNAWITDRTFRDGKQPLLEERLHLADEILTAGSYAYTVVLRAKPSDVPEVVSFDGLNSGTVEYTVRDEVSVVFSKEIDLSTFSTDDLVLKKNGVHVTDLEDVTIVEMDGSSQTCKIKGLSGICDEYGHYELTVQCAGIADLSGQLGTVGKSVGWTYTTTEAPYVVDAEGVPTKAVRSLDSLVAVISTAIDPDSISRARIMLNDTDVSESLSFRTVDASGTRFEIVGLDSLQINDGEYVLSIDGEGLRGLDGTVGVDTFTRSWTRDTVAPVLEGVEMDESLGGPRIVLRFSEAVDQSTLALTSASLVRAPVMAASRPLLANAPQSLLDGAEIEDLGNGTYAIGGFAAATSADGVYTFIFDASQVSDEAGNVSTGSKSVSWTVDTTPPGQPTELAVSSDHGSVDEVVYSCEGALTVSGKAAERGVTVQVISRAIGGVETVLATPAVASDGTFSADVELPTSGGNMAIVVRQTDAAGNSSDREIRVYYDKIVLTANLSREVREGVVTREVVLTFSDGVDVGDVTLAKFALTRDGDPVTLDGAKLTASADGKTFVLSGLEKFCSTDGDYVLTFAAEDVCKKTSGLKASACAPLTWHYECPDREPPTIASIQIDGEDVRSLYTNGISSVSITFSENVNVQELAQNGLIDQALKIHLMDADLNVTGMVRAVRSDVVCEDDGMAWTLPAGAVGAGYACVVVDAGLVTDLAGNRLAVGEYAHVDGLQDFDFKSDIIATADSYAMPTWYDFDGDGLDDLVVGEKTAAGEGKVRVYRNVGSATEPRFSGFTYLKVGGSDLSIAASGCQGAQVAFGDLTGDGNDDLIVGYANGKVQMWCGTVTRGTYGESEVLVTGSEPTYGSDRAFVCPYDLDGDGKLELAIGGLDGKFRMFKYVPGGESTESWLTDAAGAPLTVATGRSTPVLVDVNNDGCVDILTGDTSGNVWVFLGNGETWNATAVLAFDNATAKQSDRSRIGYGDLNGDGIGDLLVGRTDGSVELALGAETESPAFAFRVKGTYTVTFDLGEHGTLKSGDLVQSIVEDDSAVAPEVTVDDCYFFDDWDGTFDSIIGDAVVRAKYTHKPPVKLTVAGVIADAAAAASYNNGDYEIVYGDEVTVTVPKSVTNAVEKITVCAGWAGTGSVPSSGTSESVKARMVADSTVTWSWQVSKWWLSLGAENGTLSVASGWQTAGSTVNVTATPYDHYVFKRWSGDLDGCTIDGAVATLAMDRKRSVVAEFELAKHTVKIGDGMETTIPSAGEYDYAYGSMATVTVVNAVQYFGATQFVCTGWSAINTEPTGGEGTQAVFKVIGDTEIRWSWQTNVLTLAEAVNAPEQVWEVGGAANWQPEWTPVAPDGKHQAMIDGIANDGNAYVQTKVVGSGNLSFSWCSQLASRNTKLQFMVDDTVTRMLTGTNGWGSVNLTILGGGEHTLKWRLFTGRSGASPDDFAALDGVTWTVRQPPSLAEALNTNLVWNTEGDVPWVAVERETLAESREAWATAHDLSDNETSTIRTRIYGTGVLTFDWAVSCEAEYDWLELTVDGDVRGYIDGETGWNTHSVAITGDGWHEVCWSYVKDEMDDPDLVGDNEALLDNVRWVSNDILPVEKLATDTTPVPVPYSELESRYRSYLDAAGGDYERAANATGRNGYRIWESYLAGLDPDVEDSKLIADIKIVNGEAIVTWRPDLNENGTKQIRVYRKFGRKQLGTAEDWSDMNTVPEAERKDYRFFKVTVEMPK